MQQKGTGLGHKTRLNLERSRTFAAVLCLANTLQGLPSRASLKAGRPAELAPSAKKKTWLPERKASHQPTTSHPSTSKQPFSFLDTTANFPQAPCYRYSRSKSIQIPYLRVGKQTIRVLTANRFFGRCCLHSCSLPFLPTTPPKNNSHNECCR